MRYLLSETIEDNGPRAFSSKVLSECADIFQERSALFYTPTKNIPKRFVGTGKLNVFLPVCTPDWYECFHIRSYMSPKLWAHLLQRHTGFIRWKTLLHPTVTFVRYDVNLIREDHLVAGIKSLRDALKVKTTGRRDGHVLHYFGAIFEDDPHSANFVYRQKPISPSSKAGVRITVSES